MSTYLNYGVPGRVWWWSMEYVDEILATHKRTKPKKPVAVIGKICSTCKRDLELTKYNKRRESPDGLDRICKACKSAYDKVKGRKR